MTEEIKNKLKAVSLFKNLACDEPLLDKVANIVEVLKFKKGDFVIKEGEQGSDMFILNQGNVMVEKKTLKEDTYTVVELKSEWNVFFGEQALMDADVRSASVLAVTDCECFRIKKTDFDKLSEEEYKIGFYVTREIAKILSGRLRKSSQDNIILFEALVTEIEELED